MALHCTCREAREAAKQAGVGSDEGVPYFAQRCRKQHLQGQVLTSGSLGAVQATCVSSAIGNVRGFLQRFASGKFRRRIKV